MTTVLIRLSGPIQSWGGHESRIYSRGTYAHPTKSGVLGLVASALGRAWTDDISDLAALKFAVRCDQTPEVGVLRDYQTVDQLLSDGRPTTRVTERFYLQGHVFVAALEGDDALIRDIDDALKSPRGGALFLGRKACVPDVPVRMGVSNESLIDALLGAPWQAHEYWQHKNRNEQKAYCPIYRDGTAGEHGERLYDHPISFDTDNRAYAWRVEVRHDVDAALTNPLYEGAEKTKDEHDVFSLFGEVVK